MSRVLTPPPDPRDTRRWRMWTSELIKYIQGVGELSWNVIDLTDSDLADLTTRQHADLAGIGTNTHEQIDTAVTASSAHIAATSAHGASGPLVGTGNVATTAAAGVVRKSAAVTDAAASTVAVASADASDLGTVVTLANELKADLTTLVADLNAAITQLNAKLAADRTAGQQEA